MKKADDVIIKRLLEICKYIKWENLTEKEYNKLKQKVGE